MITLKFVNNGKIIGSLESGIFFERGTLYIGFYAIQFRNVFAHAESVPDENITV